MEHALMKFTKGDDANRLYTLVRKLEDMGLVRVVGKDYDIIATANFSLSAISIGPTEHKNRINEQFEMRN